MLDHLVGLLVRVFNAQVTGAKPLQVQRAVGTLGGPDDGGQPKRFGSTNYMCELCIGASATRGVGKSNIDLSMILSTRSLSIITHSFNSVRLRDAFMDFLMSEDCTIDRTIRSIELAELALLEGRNVLARKLDAIAKRQVRTNGRTVH
jgi:hypothetical protein